VSPSRRVSKDDCHWSDEPGLAAGGPWNGPCNGWQGPVERQERIGPTNYRPRRRRPWLAALIASRCGAVHPFSHHAPAALTEVKWSLLPIGAAHRLMRLWLKQLNTLSTFVPSSLTHRGQLSVNVLSAIIYWRTRCLVDRISAFCAPRVPWSDIKTYPSTAPTSHPYLPHCASSFCRHSFRRILEFISIVGSVTVARRHQITALFAKVRVADRRLLS